MISRFLESVHEIELIIAKLIHQAMTKAVTVEQIVDTLEIFVSFRQRSVRTPLVSIKSFLSSFQAINHVLNDKIRDLSRLFLSHIEQLRAEIVAHQTLDDATHFFDRFLPQFPAKVMWIRNLIDCLHQDYHRLVESSDLLEPTQISDLKLAYDKFMALTENIQKRIYQEWWSLASELQPRKLLQKPFLKENHQNKHLIDVYFDPQILIALNESLWWIRMKFEIPFSLTDVYNTRKSFRQMREETNEFIRKFNK